MERGKEEEKEGEGKGKGKERKGARKWAELKNEAMENEERRGGG